MREPLDPGHVAHRLELDGVAVRRGGREVISNCARVFGAGEVHGVLGRNGAGKTTLFDAIFGLTALSAGSIMLDARPVAREDVAYLPADLRLYDGITGEELLLLFARSSPIPQAVRQYAKALDIPMDALIGTYSFGTRRKLGLVAIAMLHRPVLLLDESFEALDIVSRRVVRSILRAEAGRGRIVIYSAHELEALPTFSDRISLLRDGRFVGEFPAQSMAELELLLMSDVAARLSVFEEDRTERS